jgi:hypothetical protein
MYEIADSLDAYDNCSIWYPPDDGGLTAETCRGDINSMYYAIVNSVHICRFVLIITKRSLSVVELHVTVKCTKILNAAQQCFYGAFISQATIKRT